MDDGSPADYAKKMVTSVARKDDHYVIEKAENEGFSTAVNVGIEMAQNSGQDTLLINSDIEFHEPGWLEAMEQSDGDVIGALLLYPSGRIQHAGVFYSMISRQFDHIFKHAPGDFALAQERRRCPVTAALQLIRKETIDQVGTYDESFRLGWEDVDFCQRVFEAGLECWYDPAVKAIHHESVFRGRSSPQILRWQKESWDRLITKHAGQGFSEFIPTMILDHEGAPA